MLRTALKVERVRLALALSQGRLHSFSRIDFILLFRGEVSVLSISDVEAGTNFDVE
jgi:hypothetical protein